MSIRSTLPSGQVVFDPRGTVIVSAITLSTRLRTLQGARLGVLDNSKWNASKLLRQIVVLLRTEATPTAINWYKKESFSRVASDELLDRISVENDAVVTAVGD